MGCCANTSRKEPTCPDGRLTSSKRLPARSAEVSSATVRNPTREDQVATASASFVLAFARVGLMPDGGASALVAASIGRTRAMKMALLAERLPANEAFEYGLVSSVHPADELEAAADAVINQLASGPAIALRKTKHAVNAATLTELDEALVRETKGQLILLHTKDFAEGTRAFQERRPAQFSGA